MKRKTPIRHRVQGHYRQGKRVNSFERGTGKAPRRSSRIVRSTPKPDYHNYWLDLGDIVQAVGRYKIGKIVEIYPDTGEANIQWVHPITEEPTRSFSTVPLKDLRKVVEVVGASGSMVVIRDSEGKPVGHKRMNRYHITVEDIDGEKHRTDGPIHHRRSPKIMRDLRRKYR